jgi:pimeloyl-ACP methyl ester carboxylesterase
LIGSAAVLGAAAIYNSKFARDAEHRYPPIGGFLNVNGVRMHYIECGQGDPVVLIHGNGGMLQDFTVSGLVDHLSSRHRVIVFDRPGFGYSDRPRGLWTGVAYQNNIWLCAQF